MTDAEREAALAAIAVEVAVCKRCRLHEGRTRAGPGEGSAGTEVVFVGEGPGFNEDKQGRPFVGQAGALLDDLLKSVLWARDEVFITNVVKCRPIKEREGRPPTNRAPEPSEIAACWNYLESQITLVGPRVIVALGVTAVARLLGPGAQVGESRGQGHFHGNIPVVATYHPSPLSLHRQPGRRAMVLDDLSLAKRLLDGQEDPLPRASPDI